MEDVLFIGPVADTGGPAIKNRILVNCLKNRVSLKIWNTYDKSVKARLGAFISILFAKQKYIIIAVSRKGRALLYPFLRFKARVSGCKYSVILIGGQAAESISKKSAVRALYGADVLTVETEGMKAQMEQAFKLNNVHWMPNYKEFTETIRVSEDDFHKSALRMIFLSSMRNAKGIKTLLEAFQKSRAEGVNVELDFYGPIRKDFDLDLLRNIEKIEGAEYCGVVKNDDVLKQMARYQVFVFPTECLNEGFPAVLVEAQYVGLPIIASDISYNSEIIKDNVNGFIFPHGDADALAEKIKYCCAHRDELAEISRRNIAAAKQYDASAVINAYADELKKSGWPV
jgi:glycosyltransferase involved in cell wall biosynthesis